MFDRFGEFDSAEEMNRAAAAQLAEGDMDAVLAIAEENGIEQTEAEDYIEGITTELVTPLMAALGKLKMEQEEYEIGGILEDWVQQIQALCIKEEQMRNAVLSGKLFDAFPVTLNGAKIENNDNKAAHYLHPFLHVVCC